MAREFHVEIYDGLMCIAGPPRDGQFIRQRSLEVTSVTKATEKIERGLRQYDKLGLGRLDRQPPVIFPSLPYHLASRREQPTKEKRDEISTTHFWLEAAVWLRRAQFRMRDTVFEKDWEEVFPFSKTMMLRTFQHYILVCLGQGQIATPWPLPEIDHVDTGVPNLDMICMEWEKAEDDYWEIILHDEFWLDRAYAVSEGTTKGQQMRWKVAVLYQRSLLVL